MATSIHIPFNTGEIRPLAGFFALVLIYGGKEVYKATITAQDAKKWLKHYPSITLIKD